MKRLTHALAFAGLAFAALASHAQADFPNRPIRLVVPFAPGGASDAIARPLGQAMSAILGQAVVVENRAGAAGNIALDLVARSPADGYTMMLGNMATNAMNQTSYAHTLKVVPSKDLVPVGMVATTPSVLVATSSFKPKTVHEFVTYARANPGKLNYYVPALASGSHFDMVKLETFAGIKMTPVPISGGTGPAMTALIGGQVELGIVNLGSALPQIKSGNLRALAVSMSVPELPGIPTALDAGLGASISSVWQGLFVPAAVPKPVVLKLHAALNKALNKPEVIEALAKAGTKPMRSKSPDDAQAWVLFETHRWWKTITDSGTKAQ